MTAVRRRAAYAAGICVVTLVVGVLGMFDVLPDKYWIVQWILIGIALGILTRNQIDLIRERKRLKGLD